MSTKFKVRCWLKEGLRKIILPTVYKYYCIRFRKIDKKLVVFAEAHHIRFPNDMYLVRKAVEEQGYHVVSLVHDFSKLSFKDNLFAILQFMKYYAQAGYVFLCDYYLPVISVKKRKGTKVIQLWHACGTYKKFGYDAEDDLALSKERNLFKNWDLVMVSSEECRSVYAEAFHIPEEKVKALGVSRTDNYFSQAYMQECEKEFYEKYPQAMGKKILLWAPTFRKNAVEANLVGLEEIEWLSEKLSEKWYIIKKVHPHAEREEKFSNCSIPTERLYAVADLLVTDYSSVIYDFALTGKPILIYAPDEKEYQETRGFYIRMNDLPAKRTTKKEDLLEWILENNYTITEEKYKAFVHKQLEKCDGHSTHRIIEYVLRGMEKDT